MKISRDQVIATIAVLVFAVSFIMYLITGPHLGGLAGGKSYVYYCADSETIRATFSGTKVKLTLSDGRILNLRQSLAQTGIRYEGVIEGNSVVLAGEGYNLSLSEGGQITYRSCTAAKINSNDTSGMSTYTDSARTFSFTFPSGLQPAGTDPGYLIGWSTLATSPGTILARVMIPRTYMPYTNFADARFTIGMSVDSASVAECVQPRLGTIADGSGRLALPTFTKITFASAGAGNIYETTSYRALHDNACYSIEYTIHYTQLDNYPAGTVTAFDKQKLVTMLDEMAKSFKFLK